MVDAAVADAVVMLVMLRLRPGERLDNSTLMACLRLAAALVLRRIAELFVPRGGVGNDENAFFKLCLKRNLNLTEAFSSFKLPPSSCAL